MHAEWKAEASYTEGGCTSALGAEAGKRLTVGDPDVSDISWTEGIIKKATLFGLTEHYITGKLYSFACIVNSL